MIGDIANHLWQSTLCAAASGLLVLLVRRSPARVRYWIWLAASVKFFVPFAVFVALGSQVQWAPEAGRRAAPAAAAIVQITEPFSDAVAIAPPSTSPEAFAWPRIAVAVWALGLLAMLWMRLRLWRRIRAIVCGSAPAGVDAIEIPEGVRVRSAAGVLEPSLVGIFRPILLLPADIEQYVSPRQLRAVIAHELCHARRRDNLTAAVHMAVETVFWFHPLIWWIGARLVNERERACDEEVVRQLGHPQIYAEGILAVCRRYVHTRLMCVAGVGGADLKKRIETILMNQAAARLTLAAKAALTTAALTAVAAPFALGMSRQLPAMPGPPVDPNVRFEVVSIRPYDSSSGPTLLYMLNGRLEARGVPLRQLLRVAFRVLHDDMLAGAPGWVDTERYAIIAKAPDGAPPSAMPTMIVNLLKDRFGFAMHTETRQLPVFVLELARSDRRLGPSLKPSSAECQALMKTPRAAPALGPDGRPALPGTPGGPPLFDADQPQCGSRRTGRDIVGGGGLPIAELALSLAQFTGRPVHDQTGLTGIYDYVLKFAPTGMFAQFPMGALPVPAAPPDSELPTIFTAVQEQLGLRLADRRGPVDVVVIDRIERPAFD